MTLQELIVKVSADIANYAQGMDAVLRKSHTAGAALDSVGTRSAAAEASLQNVGRTAETIGSKMSGLGTTLTAGVTLPLVGLAAAALKTAGDLEQNTIAFTTMMKSAEGAQKHLDELKEFALKTPFQFTDLVIASKRMQAYGFAAKEVVPVLRNIGDAAAALGLGAEGINRIVIALGQMKAKGAVQAEEMRQLAEAGIPAWQILAKTLNTDVAGAMKQVEARTVEAAKAIPAILAGMNEQFGGLMEKQSKTLLGQWSNLKDAISFTLQDLGKTLAPVATNVMEGVLQPMLVKVKELAAGFAALSPGAQQFIITMGGLAAVSGPALLVTGKLISSFGQLAVLVTGLPALFNPVTVGIAALGTAAAAGFYELSKGTSHLRSLDDEFGKYVVAMVEMETAAGHGDYAQKKLNEALAAGAISAGDYAKAIQLIELVQNRVAGAAITGYVKEMGLTFTVLADNSAKAAAGVTNLAEQQTKLDNEVARTRAVFQEAQKQFADHAISARVLAKAHDDYKEALDKAAGSAKSHILTVADLLQKQSHLNAEVKRAQEVFAEVQRRYDAGKASAEALALAHQQLAAAMKAAHGDAQSWSNIYDEIIEKQRSATEEAKAAAIAYLHMKQDYEAGDPVIARAWEHVNSKMAAAKVAWDDIIDEPGRYAVEMIKAGEETQRVFLAPAGQAMRTFSDGMNKVQVDAKAFADAASSGIEKFTKAVGESGQMVEYYVGHVAKGADAWQANGAAAAEVLQPVEILEQWLGRANTDLNAATRGTDSLYDGMIHATHGARAFRGELGSILDDFSNIVFQAGRITAIIGQISLDEYSMRWQGVPGMGGRLVVERYPEGGVPTFGETRRAAAVPEDQYYTPSRHPGRTGYEEPDLAAQEQERLNEQLLAMIKAKAGFGDIQAFAQQIGAYVGWADMGQLVVELRHLNQSLDAADRGGMRVPYMDMSGALEGATDSAATALTRAGETVAASVAGIAEVVTKALGAVADTASAVVQNNQWIADLTAASLAPPEPPAITYGSGGAWIRDIPLRDPRQIIVSGNTFRSRADEDYLVQVVQERL